MMMERPLSWAYPAMEASSWLTPSVASMTSSAMSAASRCLRAMTTESFSAMRCVLPLRRMPAVSMKRKRRPLRSTISSTASRVVPGIGETMARSEAVRQFSSVDLPTLGWPMMATLVSCELVCAPRSRFVPRLLIRPVVLRALGGYASPWAEPRELHRAGRRCPRPCSAEMGNICVTPRR